MHAFAEEQQGAEGRSKAEEGVFVLEQKGGDIVHVPPGWAHGVYNARVSRVNDAGAHTSGRTRAFAFVF